MDSRMQQALSVAAGVILAIFLFRRRFGQSELNSVPQYEIPDPSSRVKRRASVDVDFASDAEMLEYIKSLAKSDLHCHLNGSVRSSTLRELSPDGSSGGVVHTIEDAFNMFKKVYSVVRDEAILRRIVRETLEDALAENIRYLELRTTPRKLDDVPSRIRYVQIVADEISRFKFLNTLRPLTSFPANTIAVRLLLTIDRAQSLAMAEETVEIATKFRNTVVGIDFAGNPNIGQFKDFADVFKSASRKGLYTTVHTSEIQGVESETDDILKFRPNRVGHFLFPTEQQLKTLQQLKIPIESCPSSNICAITGKNPLERDVTEHTLFETLLKSRPLSFSVNTDDPGVFGQTLSDEIFAVAKTHNLSSTEIRELVRAAGYHAFLAKPEKEHLIEALATPTFSTE